MTTKAIWMAAALAAAGVANAGTIEQKMPADARGAVQINLTSGQVEVTGWDRPEVKVIGELAQDTDRVDLTRDGATINVKVVMKNPGRAFSSGSRLKVMMPSQNGLRVSGVSADLKVTGVRGEQSVQTVSGDIDTQVASSDVELKTVSGDVTSTGKIEPGAHVKVTTVSGDLNLRWLGSEAANIGVETLTGDIDNCFGAAVVEHSHAMGKSWNNNPQNASAEIHVKSVSGDVMLCNKQTVN